MNNGIIRVVRKSFVFYHRDIERYRYYSNRYLQGFHDGDLNNLMPKDKQQLEKMLRQREKLKEKNRKYLPSVVSLQVLGSGAKGAPTSLYVCTDHTKYLFNCGEGTQRLAYEHRLKLSKLEHIFLTSATWRNIGGLPGIALTIQDSGVPSIRIHGPKGSCDLFRAVERFIILKGLAVTEAPCSEVEPYVDQAMSVKYVFLTKKKDESVSQSIVDEPVTPSDDIDYYNYERNSNGKRSSFRDTKNHKSAKFESHLKGDRIEDVLAYVCKLHPKRGALLLDKCVDMGVAPGPVLGDLKDGKDVTLPDGRIVRSSDVCEPADPGPVFIVLECPNENYLDSLTSHLEFANHQSSASNITEMASCVVHFTPENVLNHPQYREWMEKFPSTTKHMIINEENRCMGSEAIHRIQYKLHLLHPEIFPLLSTDGLNIDNEKRINKTMPNDNEDEIENVTSLRNVQVKAPTTFGDELPFLIRSKTLDTMNLRPPRGFDTSSEFVVTPHAYIDETFEVDGFLDALAELQTEINARTKNVSGNGEYPKIIMLGTGSCVPNKTRNTSGMLLRLDEERSIILDCGEGTAGQLIRFYGRTEVDKILSTIKAIYVSHLHADHHLGLIGLLNERARVTKEPAVILAPEQISHWLSGYNNRFEPIAENYRLISNRDLFYKDRTFFAPAILQQHFSGVSFKTTFVNHCAYAYGISIATENGYKIVYSGDTMPCDALVELGANCDLLIHEATMEDDLVNEAKLKLHSTMSQAIGIGERMGAKFILLTHFSQRYSKIPYLPDHNDAKLYLSKVGVAYDNMQISISQLHLLPLFYPGLKLMFNEFCSLLESKNIKRQYRLEREKNEGIAPLLEIQRNL